MDEIGIVADNVNQSAKQQEESRKKEQTQAEQSRESRHQDSQLQDVKKRFAEDIVRGLRQYAEACRKRRKICMEYNLKHAAETAWSVANIIEFCCCCFDVVIHNPDNEEERKATLSAIEDGIKKQVDENIELSHNLSHDWFWRLVRWSKGD